MRPRLRRATLPFGTNSPELEQKRRVRPHSIGGPPFTKERASRADRAKAVLAEFLSTPGSGHLTALECRRLRCALQAWAASVEGDLEFHLTLRAALGEHMRPCRSEQTIYTDMTRLAALLRNSVAARRTCLQALKILSAEGVITWLPDDVVAALALPDRSE